MVYHTRMSEVSLQERTSALLSQNDIMSKIQRNISSGGSLIDLCKTWDVLYCDVYEWIRSDKTRSLIYDNAMAARDEWFKQEILGLARECAGVDPVDLFKADGTVKDIQDIPPKARLAITGIDVAELYDQEGQQIGVIKKIRLSDRLKAAEMLGKYLSMFVERKVVEVNVSMSDKIAEARKRAKVIDV